MSRLLLGTGMVAAAWALAITSLVFVGDAKADAAWATAGPGNASAKAEQLAAPTSLTVTTIKCTGSNRAVSLSWPAVTHASGYEVWATDTAGANRQKLTTVSTNSIASIDLPYRPAVLTVRGTFFNWLGLFSPSATGCP